MGSNYVQITVLENLCKLVHTESESGSSTGGPRLLGGPHSQLFFYYHFVSFTFYNPLLWVIWPNLTAEWHFYTAIYWNTWASYLLGYHMCTDNFVRHNILVNQLDSDNHNPQYPPDQLQKVKLTWLTLAQVNMPETRYQGVLPPSLYQLTGPEKLWITLICLFKHKISEYLKSQQ